MIISESKPQQAQAKDYKPNVVLSVWQILNSIVPFLGLVVAMYYALTISYAVTLALGVLAGGFMLRIFIIQHDCGHGSFFRSRKVNNRMGWLCSVFTLVPYYYWRRQHALHHATSGNLDRRGYGDVSLCTVGEYQRMSKWRRFTYRFYRHPLVFLFLGPAALYLITTRLVFDRKQSSRRDRRSVYVTDLTAGVIFLTLGFWIGFGKLLIIAVPVAFMAGHMGIWLFYVQHQFEHAYWKREPEWNFFSSAMQGSSYLKLPKILQWFTGNIGFHHIHHLKETIPNYWLQQCYDETPDYHQVTVITLRSSLRTTFLSVWDEDEDRLISFRELARKAR